jgi:hypothetical protein
LDFNINKERGSTERNNNNNNNNTKISILDFNKIKSLLINHDCKFTIDAREATSNNNRTVQDLKVSITSIFLFLYFIKYLKEDKN